jgi:protein subunit release factor A
MNASINAKLEQISMRLEEIGVMLSNPEVCANQNKFRELSIELPQSFFAFGNFFFCHGAYFVVILK